MAETCADKPAPLKVLLLAPTTVVGGITTWARFLLKFSDPARVTYHVIDTSKLFDPLGRKLGLRGTFLGLWDAAKRLVSVVRALRSFRPDLVYFTCAPSIGLTVRDVPYMLLLRLLGVPAVAHLHGGNVRGFFGAGLVRRTINRWGLRTCRAILVITRECEEAARRFLDADQVIYVPNMLDDELLARQAARTIRPADAPGPWRLLHVAWQAPVKGTLDLLGALPHLRHSVECHFVGDVASEYEILYQARMRELGIEDRARFMGIKRGEDLDAEFREADVFVFPTHREGPEGFPMVLLEAMTYGLPIVANCVGNIPEMIGAGTERPCGVRGRVPAALSVCVHAVGDAASDPRASGYCLLAPV